MKLVLLSLSTVLVAAAGCKTREYNQEDSRGMAAGGAGCSNQSGECRSEVPIWPLSEPSCKRNVNDRFELGGTIRFGQYAKQKNVACIDKTHVRPIVVMTNRDAEQFGFTSDVKRADYASSIRGPLLGEQFADLKNLVIGNVEDIDDQLLVAQIPVDAIEDVFFHIERFEVGAFTGAHGQLRLVFNRPVKFRPQYPASANTPVTESYDLILSINGVRTAGVPFDPIVLGVSDAYVNGWGVLTSRERYLDSFLRQKNPTEQWRLRLSANQAKKVLLSYLGWSEFWEYRRVYHTYLQSCGTEQFYNMDSAIGTDLGVKKPNAFVPYMPKEAQAGVSAGSVSDWDAPKVFKLDKGAQQVLGRFFANLPGDAVADMFPLQTVDGFFGARGPLRDRKLVEAGDVDRVEDFNETTLTPESLARVEKTGTVQLAKQKVRVARTKAMHESLCAMAQSRLSAAEPNSWAAMTWSNALKNCASK